MYQMHGRSGIGYPTTTESLSFARRLHVTQTRKSCKGNTLSSRPFDVLPEVLSGTCKGASLNITCDLIPEALAHFVLTATSRPALCRFDPSPQVKHP